MTKFLVVLELEVDLSKVNPPSMWLWQAVIGKEAVVTNAKVGRIGE